MHRRRICLSGDQLPAPQPAPVSPPVPACASTTQPTGSSSIQKVKDDSPWGHAVEWEWAGKGWFKNSREKALQNELDEAVNRHLPLVSDAITGFYRVAEPGEKPEALGFGDIDVVGRLYSDLGLPKYLLTGLT